MSMIEVKDLCKSFGSRKLFDHLNFSVEEGEVIAIIGASGCGKSMFLRSIEMLEKPDSGQIFIGGREITAKGADINDIRRGLGMVYQDFGLFSNMNVMDNLCIAPVKLLGMDRADAEEKALELLEMVGLAARAYEDVRVLSGGQKQRIAIARCMMMDPPVILFDEPTSALDPTMVGEVLATIRMLAKRGLTMMIVTHEMDFARSIADRVVFFADGGIYEEGSAEDIFENPQKEKTIAFIRKLKNMSYHIESRSFDLMELQGRIINFAAKYGLDADESYRLQLLTEEMLYELFAGCFADSAAVDVEIEISHFEDGGQNQLLFRCPGEPYNPFSLIEDANTDLMDHLGLVIISKKAEKYEYEYSDRCNIIRIKL